MALCGFMHSHVMYFMLQEQIRQMLQAYSINDELVAEIERLKEENLRLKTKY